MSEIDIRIPVNATVTVMSGGLIRVDSVPCGNCDVYRTVGEDGVVERCENCGDDEYDVRELGEI